MISADPIQRELELALAYGQRRLRAGEPLLPLLILTTSPGTVPLIFTSLGEDPASKELALHMLGATAGLAYGATSYVALNDGYVRRAVLPGAARPALRPDISDAEIEKLGGQVDRVDCVVATYVEREGVRLLAMQPYRRRRNRIEFEAIELQREVTAAHSAWGAFFRGMDSAALVARVGGVDAEAARLRAQGLVARMRRPANGPEAVMHLDLSKAFR